ncbi:S49 family peptidase [Roseomonas sp. USHLN139]|uniref:S49 family peptidase n=1 Tax=Roseomonas sp. USHLN139 TaxID=3081298 RepID=UPI003B0106D4
MTVDASELALRRLSGSPLALCRAHGDAALSRVTAQQGQARQRQPGAYEVVDGVAVVSVSGLLVHDAAAWEEFGGVTGYDDIRLAVLKALEDRRVAAIVLYVNSPGGEVSGMLDLSRMIASMRGIKPIWGICADQAYSAAYCVISACDVITVPDTGGVGSVGILWSVVDCSRQMDKLGIRHHWIHDGDKKAVVTRAETDGVTPEVLERMAQDARRMGLRFREVVSANRGIPIEQVEAQQAEYYMGEDGIAAGLADAVMAPDEALCFLMTALQAQAFGAPAGGGA